MLLLSAFYIVGTIFVILALYLHYWRNKRKFYRRNMAGREQFRSYDQSVLVNLLEDFAKFIYYFLFIVGVILLLMAYFDGHDIMRVTHW